MVKCAIKGCNNYSYKKNQTVMEKYFKFPRNKDILNVWLSACGRDKKFNVQHSKICSDHFTDDDYSLKDQLLNTPFKIRRLKKDAVPTQNVFTQDSKRSKRQEKRNQKQIVEDLLTREDAYDMDMLEEPMQEVEDTKRSVEIQTIVDWNSCRDLRILELERENRKLKAELNKSVKEAKLKKSVSESSDTEIICSNLKKIFTDGQIKKLMKPDKKIIWSSEDISSAIALHSEGARSYRYMYRKGYPIPGISTLKKWSRKFKQQSEIIFPVPGVVPESPPIKQSNVDIECIYVYG